AATKDIRGVAAGNARPRVAAGACAALSKAAATAIHLTAIAAVARVGIAPAPTRTDTAATAIAVTADVAKVYGLVGIATDASLHGRQCPCATRGLAEAAALPICAVAGDDTDPLQVE